MLLRRDLLIGAGSLGVSMLLPGGLKGASGSTDWPQFRGPDRDNISKESGLLRAWPAGGPKVLWSVPVAQGICGRSHSGRPCLPS